MSEIIYLIGIIGALFIIEKKEINKLLCYVSIMIGVGIYLGKLLKELEGEYLAYIIIMVQVSALTILYGFIILNKKSVEKKRSISYIIIPIILGALLPKEEIRGTESMIMLEGTMKENTLEDIKILREIGKQLYTNIKMINNLIIIGGILTLVIVGILMILIKKNPKSYKSYKSYTL